LFIKKISISKTHSIFFASKQVVCKKTKEAYLLFIMTIYSFSKKMPQRTKIKSDIQERGVTLYLTIVLLSTFIVTAAFLTGIIISQIKIAYTTADSQKAFFAADSGVEQLLFNIRHEGKFDDINGTLNNGATYSAQVTITGPNSATIRSVGTFQKTQRAIQANY
jgi:hypothetical protein